MTDNAVFPLRFHRYISSHFGDLRGRSAPHQGTDWPAPRGTLIRAVFGGTVVDKGWTPVYGYFVRIRSRKGNEFMAAHMNAPTRLKIGAWRLKRWRIGYVGESGAATGPHVHISVWQKQKNGLLKLVDPMQFINRY